MDNQISLVKNVNLSIILGFITGLCICFLYLKNKKRYKGPSSDEMRIRVFKFKNKCFIFNPEVTICSN